MALPIDAALVTRAQAGEESALETLLEGLARSLLPTAALLAGPQADPDPLLRDTISRVYERLRQLREASAAEAWARRIMLRLFLDGRRSAHPANCDLESVEVSTPGPDAGAIALRTAISKLPPARRALLVMHYWLGYSTSECAQFFDIPPGTVKSRLMAIRAELREALDERE